ncbi:hypothetical protein VIBHAR_04869 [Vibrio campbellii ATCC BAA-1116]|uniref:Uncharacterized protein n=1 Tax=Vibrio campbellii (strain ATCC BAA-1116) TaxID=2902295 RepID=A7N335_VIBC1|nr:hypothetical protein VIBHAR_04869 [Vibrio campbellii ATCC BAA-1116]
MITGITVDTHEVISSEICLVNVCHLRYSIHYAVSSLPYLPMEPMTPEITTRQ